VTSGYVDKNIVRTIETLEADEAGIDPLTIEEVTALLKACDQTRTYHARSTKNTARATPQCTNA
jgi:hypothetical protein